MSLHPTAGDTADLPDLAAMVDRILPRLRISQVQGWLILLAGSGAALYASSFLFNLSGDSDGPATLTGILLGLGLIGAGYGPVYARRAHEAALMPAVAQALDLSYQAKAPGFVQSLPVRLLPRDAMNVVESLLTGRVASRQVRFAEVRVRTRGKNRRTLFDGVVLEFENSVALPAFFIAPTSETTGSFWFGTHIDTTDLSLLREVASGPRRYGLWVGDPAAAAVPGLDAVVAAILAAGSDIGPNGWLYSALSDGRTTWLALSDRRDIFRIGGLFAARDSLLRDIQRAAQDFDLPLRLVGRLLAVETQAFQPPSA